MAGKIGKTATRGRSRRGQRKPESGYFTVGDDHGRDVRVYARIYGQGDNAVFFTHGLGADSYEFHLQCTALEDRYMCVAPDLRGFGNSPFCRTCSIELSAADTVSVADQLGVEQFDLVGHSLGGMVALIVALNYPERVKKLVIIDSTAGFRVNPVALQLLKAIPRYEGYMPVPVKNIIATAFAKGVVFRPDLIDEQIKDYYFGATSRLRHPDYFQTAMKYVPWIAEFDVADRLKQIKCPTLIIHGALDFGIPVWAGWQLAESIPDARMVVFNRNFHSPNIEDFEPVNEVLAAFLEGKEVSRYRTRLKRIKPRGMKKNNGR